jgi:hypothetical protein
MFYYLIYNSALGNYQEHSKRYLTTFLYGSILYLIIHAYLNSSNNTFHQSLRFYFWFIILIDFISIIYISYYIEQQSSKSDDDDDSSLKSLLGDLKNKLSSSNNTQNNNQNNNNTQNNNNNTLNDNIQNDNTQNDDTQNDDTQNDNFLENLGSTLLNNSKSDYDTHNLVYNPNEFDILNNNNNNRKDSQSPVFSDFASEDDSSDLEEFEASLST